MQNLRNNSNVHFNFYEIFFESDNLSKLNVCTWNRIAQVKTCGCRVKPHMKSLNIPRRHMMLMAYLYMTKLDAISEQWYVSWEDGEAPSPLVPKFRLGLWQRNMRHCNTINVWHIPSRAPCDVFFFSTASHFTCYNSLYIAFEQQFHH